MRAPDLIEADDTFVIGKARQRLARDALYEIWYLCDMLRTATRNTEEGPIVRGLTSRMNDLVDAVTSAIGDVHAQTGDIASDVRIALASLEADA